MVSTPIYDVAPPPPHPLSPSLSLSLSVLEQTCSLGTSSTQELPSSSTLGTPRSLGPLGNQLKVPLQLPLLLFTFSPRGSIHAMIDRGCNSTNFQICLLFKMTDRHTMQCKWRNAIDVFVKQQDKKTEALSLSYYRSLAWNLDMDKDCHNSNFARISWRTSFCQSGQK